MAALMAWLFLCPSDALTTSRNDFKRFRHGLIIGYCPKIEIWDLWGGLERLDIIPACPYNVFTNVLGNEGAALPLAVRLFLCLFFHA